MWDGRVQLKVHVDAYLLVISLAGTRGKRRQLLARPALQRLRWQLELGHSGARCCSHTPAALVPTMPLLSGHSIFIATLLKQPCNIMFPPMSPSSVGGRPTARPRAAAPSAPAQTALCHSQPALQPGLQTRSCLVVGPVCPASLDQCIPGVTGVWRLFKFKSRSINTPLNFRKKASWP